MKNLFRKHITWLRNMPVLWFITLMVVYEIILGITVFVIVSGVLGVNNSSIDGFKQYEQQFGFWQSLILIGFIAPAIETLLGQWLPILFIKIFSESEMIIILGSAFIFAMGHFGGGMLGIVIAFLFGIILSFSFLTGRAYSIWRAYWVTTTIHLIFNNIYLFREVV